MRHRRFVIVAAALLVGWSGFAEKPRELEADRDLRRVILRGTDTGRPYFVPEALLNERPLEEVLPEADRRRFLTHVDAERNPHRYRQEVTGKMLHPTCAQMEERAVEGGPVPRERVAELIGQGVAFLADVEQVVPGWRYHRVAELASLEVVEIVHNEKMPEVVPGSRLHIVIDGGRLRYQDVVLCSEMGIWHRPRPGERLLVIGAGNLVAPGFFHVWDVFEVRGGDVVLEATRSTGRATRTTALAGLAQEARAEVEEVTP